MNARPTMLVVLGLISFAACRPEPAPIARPPVAVTSASNVASAPPRPDPVIEDLPPAASKLLPNPFKDMGEVALDDVFVMAPGVLAGKDAYAVSDTRTMLRVLMLEGDRFEPIHEVEDRGVWLNAEVVGVVQSAEGSIDLLEMVPAGRTSTVSLHTIRGQKAQLPRGVYGVWGSVVPIGKSTFANIWYIGLSEIVVLRGPARKLARAQSKEPCRFEGSPQVLAESLFATPAGDLVAEGSPCTGYDGYALEIWRGAAGKSVVLESEKGHSAFIAEDDNLYVAGPSPKRWTGSAFETVASVPPRAPFETQDGRAWRMTADGRLSLREADGSYREVEVPKGRLIFDGKTLWIFGEHLHRLDDGKGPAKISVAGSRPRKKLPVFAHTAPGANCDKHVVVLYGFTKVTPDDYDFPLTRKALKGHTELKDVTFAVTEDRGKKFFAALTPKYETAKSVRTVIEKGVEGSKPQVVCATPKVVRELKIDLRTGDVVKYEQR